MASEAVLAIMLMVLGEKCLLPIAGHTRLRHSQMPKATWTW